MANRTSVVLKMINGSAQVNPGKAHDDRKVAPRRPPKLPPWIVQTPEVKQAYDFLFDTFVIEGIHGAPDGVVMNNLAETFILRNAAVQKLQQYGPIMKQPGSTKPELQPYFKAVASYNEQIIRMMKELGFTPVSRLKLAPKLEGPLGMPATWDEID